MLIQSFFYYVEDGSYPKVISSNDTIVIYQCVFGRGIIGVQWLVNGVAFDSHMDRQNITHYITEATVPINLIITNVECCLQNDAGMNICHTRVVNTGMMDIHLIHVVL